MSKSINAKFCEEIAEGKENPFWTMEAIGEHFGMLWGWYRRQGYQLPELEHGQKKPIGKTGDFDYELIVIERYLYKAFSLFSAINPTLYAASDGDEGALLLLKEQMKELAQFHQSQWDEMFPEE